MTGIHHIEIKNRQAQFKFDLRRNITVVTGESGTGKTTLFEMISDLGRLGERSGVQIRCDKKCVALTDTDWRNQLSNTNDSIVFVDEGSEFINSRDFAEEVGSSDNYYVLFYRENLHELPYSADEIYEIKTSGKFHLFRRLYKSEKHIYAKKASDKGYKILLLEDSKSGYDFYKKYTENKNISCIPSGSNSAVYTYLSNNKDASVFIIADGAAFGSEMNRITELIKERPGNTALCLPESFEWLILKSGLINSEDIGKILENPSDYIESGKYMSWEQFFTDLLIKISEKTPFKYSKSQLNPSYTIPSNADKIVSEIELEKYSRK